MAERGIHLQGNYLRRWEFDLDQHLLQELDMTFPSTADELIGHMNFAENEEKKLKLYRMLFTIGFDVQEAAKRIIKPNSPFSSGSFQQLLIAWTDMEVI